MQNEKKIELDQYGENALSLLVDSNTSFFLTGNGGTGKTFLINHFLEENKKLPEKKQKKVQMLATTGAAATLYDFGSTYHSFFRIFGEKLGNVDKEQKQIMNYFDAYIIDEASMISASQFDLIDKRLRQVTKNDELFGGKQIIFVGHLFQASPVVTQSTKDQYEELYGKKYDDVYKSIFFFDALGYNNDVFKIIELKKTHRTTDVQLQTYLKNLMLGENLTAVCAYFNKNFKRENEIDYDKAIYIANTNSKVNKYNILKLKQLRESGQTIILSEATYWNWDIDNYGRITKEPSPLKIEYAIGARIMFNKNTEYFKNGTMGEITDIGSQYDLIAGEDIEFVKILIDGDKQPVKILKEVWNKFEAHIIGQDENDEDIIQMEVVGSYTQFPFQLGWGITAHKSQGKTFDKLIIDIGEISYKDGDKWVKKAVEHIVYVALSRATSYEGIQIVQWLKPNAIAVNKDVKEITQKLIK